MVRVPRPRGSHGSPTWGIERSGPRAAHITLPATKRREPLGSAPMRWLSSNARTPETTVREPDAVICRRYGSCRPSSGAGAPDHPFGAVTGGPDQRIGAVRWELPGKGKASVMCISLAICPAGSGGSAPVSSPGGPTAVRVTRVESAASSVGGGSGMQGSSRKAHVRRQLTGKPYTALHRPVA